MSQAQCELYRKRQAQILSRNLCRGYGPVPWACFKLGVLHESEETYTWDSNYLQFYGFLPTNQGVMAAEL